MIVTTDHNMRNTHADDFRKYPNATALATCHHDCDDEVWVKAIKSAKFDIERKFKKQKRPWFAKINQLGQITVCKSID